MIFIYMFLTGFLSREKPDKKNASGIEEIVSPGIAASQT
jgi:hypothetical protein